jgi:hypothetical protein
LIFDPPLDGLLGSGMAGGRDEAAVDGGTPEREGQSEVTKKSTGRTNAPIFGEITHVEVRDELLA